MDIYFIVIERTAEINNKCLIKIDFSIKEHTIY